MAGRGRGRGSGLSLTHEQLQALGISRGESQASSVGPPPLFPKLDVKPLPLVQDAATDYMYVVSEQFAEHFRESAAYVRPNTSSDDVERYSDKYKLLAQDANQRKTLDFVWENMPAELRPQPSCSRSTVPKRKIDPKTIAKRLRTLEKKESQDETSQNVNDDGKKEDDNDEDLEDEQEQEYEVDDGTDYANNYFDNGENYDEEEENVDLDDGPIY